MGRAVKANGLVKTEGYASLLRSNGWTDAFMDAEWAKVVQAVDEGAGDIVFSSYVRQGWNWDNLPLKLIAKVPGMSDILYEKQSRTTAAKAYEETLRHLSDDSMIYYAAHTEEILVSKFDLKSMLSETEVRDMLWSLSEVERTEGLRNERYTNVTSIVSTQDGRRFFRIEWQKGHAGYQDNAYPYQPVEVLPEETEEVIVIKKRSWKNC